MLKYINNITENKQIVCQTYRPVAMHEQSEDPAERFDYVIGYVSNI